MELFPPPPLPAAYDPAAALTPPNPPATIPSDPTPGPSPVESDLPSPEEAAGQEQTVLPRESAPAPVVSGPLHPIPRILEARQTHLFNGSSGAGKTSFMGWFTAQLLTQSSILGHPCQRPPFIAYIGGDRIVEDALQKLSLAGWEAPAHFSIVDDDSSETEAHISQLGEKKEFLSYFQWILKKLATDRNEERIPIDSLIIVDSMSTIFGIEPAGSYLSKVAKPLLRLNRFCRKFKITIILIHHATKTKANDRYIKAQDRALGSMALQGFTSTQMSLTEPELTESPDSGIYLFEWRSHSAPKEEFEFRRSDDEAGKFEYLGPHYDVPEQKAPPVKSQAMLLLPFISEEWVSAPQLREKCLLKIGKTTFYRYLEYLAENSFIERELRGQVVWVRKTKALSDS